MPDNNFLSGTAVRGPYRTPLSLLEQLQFQDWLRKNGINYDPSSTGDYDMPGYWKDRVAGMENPPPAPNAFGSHFTDRYKTPYHKSFSDESQYATPNAPRWEGDVLRDRIGNVVVDERPKAEKKPYVSLGSIIDAPAPSNVGDEEKIRNLLFGKSMIPYEYADQPGVVHRDMRPSEVDELMTRSQDIQPEITPMSLKDLVAQPVMSFLESANLSKYLPLALLGAPLAGMALTKKAARSLPALSRAKSTK